MSVSLGVGTNALFDSLKGHASNELLFGIGAITGIIIPALLILIKPDLLSIDEA